MKHNLYKSYRVYAVFLYFFSLNYTLYSAAPVFPTWKSSDATDMPPPANQTQSQKEIYDRILQLRTPSDLWGTYKNTAPRPTNRWFTNLLLLRTDKPNSANETFPTNIFPYFVNLTDQSVEVGYPSQKTLTPDHEHLLTSFIQDIIIESKESFTGSRTITSDVNNNPFSATFQWGTKSKGMAVPFVRGAPFITFEMTNITPVISTIHAIVNINGKGIQANSTFQETGTKFKLTFNNMQTWFIYTSKPITLTLTNNNKLEATNPFSGVIRIIELNVGEGLPGASAPPLPQNPSVKYTEPLKTTKQYQAYFTKTYMPALKDWYQLVFAKPLPSSDEITLTGNSSQEMYNNFVQALQQKTFYQEWKKANEQNTPSPPAPTPTPAIPSTPTPAPSSGNTTPKGLAKMPAPPLPPNPQSPAWSNKFANAAAYQQWFDKNGYPALQVWFQQACGNPLTEKITLTGSTPQDMYNNYLNGAYQKYFQAWQDATQGKTTNICQITQAIPTASSSAKTKSSMTLSATETNTTNLENIIEQYVGTYPVAGTITLPTKLTSDTTFDMTITWQTKSINNKKQPLLMLCLPHHQAILQNPQYVKDIVFNSIRGTMIGITGTTWKLQDTLPMITWNAANPVPNANKNTIITALQNDQKFIAQATDSYGFGKEAAKMVRIALIAQELGETKIAETVLENIQKVLEPWVKGTNTDTLYYDSEWGGVATKNGLSSPDADFGNGWYNDHHFHYGYFIYTAAVFIHLVDALNLQSTYQSFISNLTPFITDLIFDIASVSSTKYFPDFRLMDWFLSHSCAGGLFPFGSGKNQESTSEAVNAWYGISLFGKAINSSEIENLGRMILAAEIRGAQTYWHMKENSDIYPAEFAANTCVGILWETKADYANWFGVQSQQNKKWYDPVEFKHLIQFLPFTPITDQLIEKDWNAYQYTLLQKAIKRKIPKLQEQWKGYLYMSQAISDPETAWTNIQTLKPPYDNGNSATNTLYWVATHLPTAQQ